MEGLKGFLTKWHEMARKAETERWPTEHTDDTELGWNGRWNVLPRYRAKRQILMARMDAEVGTTETPRPRSPEANRRKSGEMSR